LNWGFQHQIDAFGTYIQHSTNYHRVMLQLALYTDQLRRLAGDPDWPAVTLARLQAATSWLWALTDANTGEVPNLGASDSAYLFPLTSAPVQDYRPVIQAAARAFLEAEIYQHQALMEMSQWLDLPSQPPIAQTQPQAMDMLRIAGAHGRALIHTTHFNDRPSHADQLHVDLWWRGVNVAMDPGTYQYNATKPWDNALATAHVHNTLTLDGQDQMTLAGRFLWLDWAQATTLSHEIDDHGNLICVRVEHNGYRWLGALHQRSLKKTPRGWQIVDKVLPHGKPDHKDHTVHLTWLLPDWAWHIENENSIHLDGPELICEIKLEGIDEIELFRAGECIYGKWDGEPTWGWSSPRYGQKMPALMLLVIKKGQLPLTVRSTFDFRS